MSTQPAALILAGGKSRRLGTDKVSLPCRGGTLLSRTAALARQFCGEVWVSGRDPRGLEPSLPWLPDDRPGLGPLGGILTGLARLGRPILALACDLPMLGPETLSLLLAERGLRPATAVMTTFQQRDTGRIEPLVAVYEPQAAPLLREAAERGLYSLARAVPAGVRHHIPYAPGEAGPFFNINSPADLAELRRAEQGANSC